VSNPSPVLVPTGDDRRYRDLLGRFASGVVIVAGLHDGAPVGLACQSFFSLSLSPRLIAVAPALASSSWARIAETGRFAVSILGVGQEGLCRVFGRAGQDKFAGAAWDLSGNGSPVIRDALGWLDCDIADVHDGGDHHLVVGRVLEAAAGSAGSGLLFHRGDFGHFVRNRPTDVHEPTWDEGPWIEGIQ